MRIHMVRHGEVANPNHVVYGDLPGFNLSPRGVLQAHAAGVHLADQPVGAVVTSPLARARQTATAIARHHGLEPVPDDRLVETRQFPHWTNLRWDDVRTLHRVEYDAYLEDATSDAAMGGAADGRPREGIAEVAERGVAAVRAAVRTGSGDDVVVVGHQDTTQAVRLRLTGRPLHTLREDPPKHASVITLEGAGDSWTEVAVWAPSTESRTPGTDHRGNRTGTCHA